jgi:hypothetical protein
MRAGKEPLTEIEMRLTTATTKIPIENNSYRNKIPTMKLDRLHTTPPIRCWIEVNHVK